MALDNERELPLPLDGAEIKEGLVYKISEAVSESLDKTCHLFGKAYPKFKATVKIHYELDDFGRKIEGNVTAHVHDEVSSEATVEDIELVIEETPPNIFRKETEQGVPTMIQAKGKTEQATIKHVPKRGRPRKNER